MIGSEILDFCRKMVKKVKKVQKKLFLHFFNFFPYFSTKIEDSASYRVCPLMLAFIWAINRLDRMSMGLDHSEVVKGVSYFWEIP